MHWQRPCWNVHVIPQLWQIIPDNDSVKLQYTKNEERFKKKTTEATREKQK